MNGTKTPQLSSLDPRYSSTRYHDTKTQQFFTFEEVVLKGLASDGGLFHPEQVPDVSQVYQQWKDLSFADLAFECHAPLHLTTGDLRLGSQVNMHKIIFDI